MTQYHQQLITLVFATFSTLIILPFQAHNLRELTNEIHHDNTIYSESLSDDTTASNSKANLFAQRANNYSAARANAPTTNRNIRIPIYNKID